MRRVGLVTAVVGAGPAGLLFCVAARIMFERRGGDATRWPILLFDKRAAYARTHRLRIARNPVTALQRDLDDDRFDRFVEVLERDGFNPAVNRIEQTLAELAAGLGIEKQRLEIGTAPGAVPLIDLRRHLEGAGLVPSEARLTIVGADSVHSAVREAVRGGYPLVERTHQAVARMVVTGEGLPERWRRVDQYRVSKLLGSVVDYRLNPNGFAEVDVLLPGPLLANLEALGATPAAPVALTRPVVRDLRAPLLGRLVEHLRAGLTPDAAEVFLQSTFRLEHRYVERVTYRDPARRADVFLVGDAAVSLPFFRGMASLVACAHSLARTHCDLAVGQAEDAIARYERDVAEIRRAEVEVVRARARLVRGAREFARVSSLLPFPLQTWFLSIPMRDGRSARMSAGTVLNALVALAAVVCASAGVLYASELVWAAVAAQVGGGVVYRAAQELEPGPDTLVRRVWLAEIVVLFAGGTSATVASSVEAGRLTDVMPALLWLILGYVFVIGMLAYDALGRRWFARAALDE